ncbi:hypothetical protein [Aquiflexum sp.]|uniref:hypothetical protein n=1 Tax=Aquiflexum sp. TaxID=1872584 RepID=UPI003594565C
MENILIEKLDKEQSKTVKTILKALKVKFKTLEDISDSKKIAESIARGYKEMLEVKSGKLEAKNARDLWREI